MMAVIVRSLLISLLALVIGVGLSGCDEAESTAVGPEKMWPPQVGKPFPDIAFTNYDGSTIHLSDFEGKVVLVEPVGMTCTACNAFSGGHKYGGIADIRPQTNLRALEDYLYEYGFGMTLDHPDLVFVQILIYDLAVDAVGLDDVQIWAEHYRFDTNPDVFVVFSEADLRSRASFEMIPGVLLVDKTSVVRFDSTGNQRRHNLFTELLPNVSLLLRE